MRNFFKSIAIATIVGVLFLTNISTVMAAEPTQEVVSTESDNAVESRSTLVGYFHYKNINLTQGTYVGEVTLEGKASTIHYNITGSSGNVTIRLDNRETGDHRSFTAVGKGEWAAITYVSPMDMGTWDIKVLLASGSGHNEITLRFYK